MSWRRLGNLIRHLSPNSSVYRELYPEEAGWSVTEFLLADIIDVLNGANWQRGNAGASKPSRKPQPMWRPPLPGAPKKKSLEQRIAEYKARHCDRQEGPVESPPETQ